MRITISLAFLLIIVSCTCNQFLRKPHNLDSQNISIKGIDIFKPFNRTTILYFTPKNINELKVRDDFAIDSVKIICPDKFLQCVKVEPTTEQLVDNKIPILYFVSVNQEKEIASCNYIEFWLNGEKVKLPFALDSVFGAFASVPSIINFGDSLLFCAIDLIRLRPDQSEYFPTSERLRVEILNSSGKPLWRSDDSKNFLQVISEVEPKMVGQIHRYSLLIPFLAILKHKDHKFTFRLSLPIKPNPITHILEYSR